MNKKLLIIDGNSLLFRSYYALPLLYNTKGEVSNAVFGFCTLLTKAITSFKPTHILVALDYGKKTFRHELFNEYKGTRKPAPNELKQQFPILKKILHAMNIKVIEMEGYEADDIIGTVSNLFDVETKILSGDKDLLQLIDDNTEIYLTKKGVSELEIANKNWLKEKMGLDFPSQIIDLKSIMGDTSDNIPGVKGIGEKGALTLIQTYKNLDNIYNNLDKITGKQKTCLENYKEDAYLSYKLATINKFVPIKIDFNELTFTFPFNNNVKNLFQEYQFNSLLKRSDLFSNENEEELEEIKQSTKLVEIKSTISLKEVLNNINDEIAICISDNINFSFNKNVSYFVNFNHDLFSNGISLEETLKYLKPILENNKITKILFDSKKDKKLLKKFNISVLGPIYDLVIANYILSCGDKSVLENIKNSNKLFELKEEQQKKLIDKNLNSIYYNLELPLSNVLYNMENFGFKVDLQVLNQISEEYNFELKTLQEKVIDLAGEEFNINSPKQVSYILFDKLKLNCPKKKLSTASDVLEEIEMDHTIISLILNYRKLQKLVSYLESYKSLVTSDNLIHTTFNQTVTSTGRLSSSEPNLQNIPVRDDIGRNLRKIFISRFENGKIISADYNQIELRLLAHFSEDEVLTKAYNEGKDIHTQTATEIFNLNENEITLNLRRLAKTINFGIIYGISDYGLSKSIKTSVKTARNYIENYFHKFPKIKEYLNSNIAFAKQNGYIKTILGRIRKIPEINSDSYLVRQFGERVAMNTPLQGTASDIIKMAMIKIYDRIKNEELKSKLILQIHDELIIDCYNGEEEKVCNILKEEMENIVKLNIPLKVEINIGKNLYECK